MSELQADTGKKVDYDEREDNEKLRIINLVTI